ncbi:hypothetical protein EMIHUDRAFT_215227 [Emiliania huxleyi CCMP1516]|uniref:MATH domain-containing protein n=2 Tax=Emiliania huxleyi TaxID=2903 RepID=A0A0D3II40_EMIH1|nr:hypothetical protein EMIHUDRAFT_215227 [Emiliania huxleyi CCMP1516]EOD10925.1 hypothetical protein EMIHUDRAFT_215227 [Emiliania huxleyi CCMP1516]|eukprot:XP_005763354.1 hypothetical protein EMIHUDRAFT_215227 [Emiliania huxleyi CCMP1516]
MHSSNASTRTAFYKTRSKLYATVPQGTVATTVAPDWLANELAGRGKIYAACRDRMVMHLMTAAGASAPADAVFSSLAGAVLGPGVYVTAVLQKALSDAQGPSNSPNPAGQARDIGYVVRSGRLEVASPVRALVTAADNQCVHASYEWKLERLDPLDFLLVTGASATRKPGGLALESPVFQIPTCEGELDSWMLRIFPKGNAESGDHPGVGLYLAVPTTINPEPPYDELCTELQLRYLHFTLTVVNQRDPSKSIVRKLPHAVLGRYMRDWGLRDILQRSALFSPFSDFVVGGTLIVRVDATVLPLALLEETVDKREAARRAAGSDETCAICLDPLEEAAGRFQPFHLPSTARLEPSIPNSQ